MTNAFFNKKWLLLRTLRSLMIFWSFKNSNCNHWKFSEKNFNRPSVAFSPEFLPYLYYSLLTKKRWFLFRILFKWDEIIAFFLRHRRDLFFQRHFFFNTEAVFLVSLRMSSFPAGNEVYGKSIYSSFLAGNKLAPSLFPAWLKYGLRFPYLEKSVFSKTKTDILSLNMLK
jgi:hypothetical protein